MTENWKQSVISRKFPSTFYDTRFRMVSQWILGKQQEDDAEGLWRIKDSLYDFSDFISRHPGGRFWLETTRGTDITEAFEIHHISIIPENMINKFKIRDAKEPRNITLTLNDDGFYKTLKKRVRDKLKSIDYHPSSRSDLLHTGLLLATFLTAIMSVILNSNFMTIIASFLLCWTVISSHNYFHRRDNWRMYCFNLGLMNVNDWRISHALSHHIYTNSFHDLEISMFEPYFMWIPNPYVKTAFQRYGSWIYGPLIYVSLFPMSFIKRIIFSLKKQNVFYYDDIIAFTLPLAMYLTTGGTLYIVLKTWILIILGASFIFSLIGLNAAHHHPDIHHDGDVMRSDRDWGLFQLDTVIERADFKNSHFFTLTHFGDHAMHHLFPTLDHGILPQLYPILYDTMEEFNGELRECSQLHHFIGQHKQLARIEANPIPRDEIIKSKKK
ncbi:cytochrome b5-related protein-like [Condylostylus longicornis]|uniref:cytochrome b5-related protein-like n=1 Tax=Condylostylus longicornis TaxID=2530218 RepID=UPI00244DCB03|nr:cytochrome b5-related protein-like [Condylostylus longicornis]